MLTDSQFFGRCSSCAHAFDPSAPIAFLCAAGRRPSLRILVVGLQWACGPRKHTGADWRRQGKQNGSPQCKHCVLYGQLSSAGCRGALFRGTCKGSFELTRFRS
jgi:hypothetical protein